MTKLCWSRFQNRPRYYAGEPAPSPGDLDHYHKTGIKRAMTNKMKGKPATDRQIWKAKKECARTGWGYPIWMEGSRVEMSKFIERVVRAPSKAECPQAARTG